MLMFSSKKSYRLLRKAGIVSRLPHENTVRKWVQHFECRPGHNTHLMKLLSYKNLTFTDKEQPVSQLEQFKQLGLFHAPESKDKNQSTLDTAFKFPSAVEDLPKLTSRDDALGTRKELWPPPGYDRSHSESRHSRTSCRSGTKRRRRGTTHPEI